ncbi:MAG: YidC/Oxa1 family insertase periplasmic-domain containing protein, partial [Planctomycetia bacterium]|nr:YidC/Oxa1 family insertase periplasmic-domain containing protein [Planctomycetia bacterium]
MQNKNLLFFTLASVGILVAWQFFMAWMYPPVPRPTTPTPPVLTKTWPQTLPPKERQQALAALAVAALAGANPELPLPLAMQSAALTKYEFLPLPRWPFAGEAAVGALDGVSAFANNAAAMARFLPAPSTELKAETVELGAQSGWFLKVTLTNQGASIRQVVLNDFQQADIYGLPVPDPSDASKPMPLQLVPERRIRMRTELDHAPDHEILFDKSPEGRLYHYQLFDYEKLDDERPVNTLGLVTWKVSSVKNDPNADQHEVSFSTDVRDRVRITKTFTLKRGDYHVGLSVKVQSLVPDKADQHKFRYQLAGARGLPIEGVWYTYTFRNALIGWSDQKGGAHRHLEDSRQIAYWQGGEEHRRVQDQTTIRYAGVAVQFFAAVVAVAEKDQQPTGRDDFIKSARATHEGQPNPQMTFLDDITVRLMTEPLALEPGSPGSPGPAVEHHYLLYHGPVKVKLLHYLKGNRAVDTALVDRYEDGLQLRTLTDHHSPGAMGSFANSIGMTWLVIKFTNLMHWLLNQLHWVLPVYGLNIIMLTLMVRGLMFPISRRQALANQKMQEKMGKLAPEVKKLQEKYKDDPLALNQARNQLYMDNGINPLSAMGGCLLIFAQMPVFLGLYYALQESI